MSKWIGVLVGALGLVLTYRQLIQPRVSVAQFRTVGDGLDSLQLVLQNESWLFALHRVRATVAVDAKYSNIEINDVVMDSRTSQIGMLDTRARSTVDFRNNLLPRKPQVAIICVIVTYSSQFHGTLKETFEFYRQFNIPPSEWLERGSCGSTEF